MSAENIPKGMSKGPQFLTWRGIGLQRQRSLNDEQFNHPIKDGSLIRNMVVERHCLDTKQSSKLAHTKAFQPLLIKQAQGCFQHPLPGEWLTRFRHDPRPLYTYNVSLQRKYKAKKEGCQALFFFSVY